MCGYSEGKKILEKNLNIAILYEGFDYSDNLILKARKLNPGLNIYKQDVTKFRPSKTYDVIILIGGLHHVPDYVDQILSVLYSCLSEKGIFINFEPTYNNIIVKQIRNRIYNKNEIFDEQTERAFNFKDLNALYIKNKYRIKLQIYPGLLTYILYYNPDAFPKLNIGNEKLVSILYKIEKPLTHGIFGKKFSFATLSVLEK